MLKEDTDGMEDSKESNTVDIHKIFARRKSSATVIGSKFRRHVVKMQTTAAITKAFSEAGNIKSSHHWKTLIH